MSGLFDFRSLASLVTGAENYKSISFDLFHVRFVQRILRFQGLQTLENIFRSVAQGGT